jgi:hypothetical protein
MEENRIKYKKMDDYYYINITENIKNRYIENIIEIMERALNIVRYNIKIKD